MYSITIATTGRKIISKQMERKILIITRASSSTKSFNDFKMKLDPFLWLSIIHGSNNSINNYLNNIFLCYINRYKIASYIDNVLNII